MNAPAYDIEISGYNSPGIADAAAANGITHMRLIASGFFWDGISKGTLLALPVEGGETRVLDFDGTYVGRSGKRDRVVRYFAAVRFGRLRLIR